MATVHLMQPSPAAAIRARLTDRAGAWLDLDAATAEVQDRLRAADPEAPPRMERVIDEVASAALVVAARVDGARGRAALERLFGIWQSDVHRWCRLLGGPGVCVEDAAHDTLLAVLTHLRQLSDPRRFRGWLWGVTWRTVRGHRRRAWLRRWAPGPWREEADPRPDPSQGFEASERSARVLAVLDTLPVEQRQLLWLAYAEGLTRAELSELLDLAPGTLNRRLTAARVAFERAAAAAGLDPSWSSPPSGSVRGAP